MDVYIAMEWCGFSCQVHPSFAKMVVYSFNGGYAIS